MEQLRETSRSGPRRGWMAPSLPSPCLLQWRSYGSSFISLCLGLLQHLRYGWSWRLEWGTRGNQAGTKWGRRHTPAATIPSWSKGWGVSRTAPAPFYLGLQGAASQVDGLCGSGRGESLLPSLHRVLLSDLRASAAGSISTECETGLRTAASVDNPPSTLYQTVGYTGGWAGNRSTWK